MTTLEAFLVSFTVRSVLFFLPLTDYLAVAIVLGMLLQGKRRYGRVHGELG
jgi:hypothetical protein